MVEDVGDAVAQRPWVTAATRLGWVAKGAVYVLMGLTAWTIARQQPTEDDASPEGALAQVVASPSGRLLAGVLALGLVLYAAWRLLSTALVRGTDLSAWLHRAGYLLSSAFYLILALTAGRAALVNDRPEDHTVVERLSADLLGSGFGRVALGVLGLVILGTGLFFVVDKVARRSFLDDLQLRHPGEGINPDAPPAERRAITAAGVAGWAGRGAVTALVGFFVLRAAVEFDPGEARGFDRSLREVATTGTGSLAVSAVAVGLVLYGVFCLLSFRHQKLGS